MNKIDKIRDLLTPLSPIILDVEDESHKHSNHYAPNFEHSNDSIYPSHVKIIISAAIFDNLTILKRHKVINEALAPAFLNGLHAASIKTYATTETSL